METTTRKKSPIFETHLTEYLKQVNRLDVTRLADKLGVAVRNDKVIVPFMGRDYEISKDTILGSNNRKADYAVCVVLCKYLLLCPDDQPEAVQWQTFKDFKSAAPLISYFSDNVERAISTHFAGRLKALEKAADALNGIPPEITLSYDLAVCFRPLPKVPLLLLYNDADEEFDADCSVLFEKRAEDYLDMECLAMVGGIFAERLKRV